MSMFVNIWDLRETARRRLPRVVFDYIDGAAEGEVSAASWSDAGALEVQRALIDGFQALALPDQPLRIEWLDSGRPAVFQHWHNQTVVYDARQGKLLLVDGTVPSIRIEAQGANLQANWGFRSTKESSSAPPPALVVDFPSFLRNPNVRAREVQSLGDGKYRLTHATQSGGMIATVDTSSPYSVTWDTTGLTNGGSYDLRVITTDNASNVFTSATVTSYTSSVPSGSREAKVAMKRARFCFLT